MDANQLRPRDRDEAGQQRLRPQRLEPGRWWNGTLRSEEQLENAYARAASAGLPGPDCRSRGWECLEALELILAETAGEDPAWIADIGLQEFSPLLDWLTLVGHGTVQPEPEVRLRANRARASGAEPPRLTHAGPATDRGYDVVLCRSLPGDRLPLLRRLRQARRLLLGGGLFILGTTFRDFPEPYQGRGRCVPDHVCCRRSLDRLIRAALDIDLVPLGPVFVGKLPELEVPDLEHGFFPLKLAFRKRSR